MSVQDSIKPVIEQGSNRNKEVRKIQFTGRSTYQLSLPKRWIKEMKLRPGDPVTIERQLNNSLCIIPNILREGGEIDEALINVRPHETESSVVRKLISAYLLGYNMIHVRCKEGLMPKQSDGIMSILKKDLVGAEVMSDSANHVTIQIMVNQTQVTMSSLVRRMMVIASAMFTNAFHALANADLGLAERVLRSGDEIGRFSFYILRNISLAMKSERVLRDIGLESALDSLFYRTVARSIEKIADGLCQMAKSVTRPIIKLERNGEEMVTAGNSVLALFENAVEAFLRKDYDLANRVIDDVQQISPVDSERTGRLADEFVSQEIQGISRHIEEIAEATLNHAIAKIIKI